MARPAGVSVSMASARDRNFTPRCFSKRSADPFCGSAAFDFNPRGFRHPFENSYRLRANLLFKLTNQTARNVESMGTELGQQPQRILDAPLAVRFEQDTQYPDHNQATRGGDATAAKLVDEKEIGAQINRQLNGFRLTLIQPSG